ncbi:MAG: Uncharacterized protein Athens101428_89 [Candidatus Berkelbacteria bacterium Athens1014_28]|uniref:O-antigen ligase-related domain-containing protein n=1 Tax=Candidatus Berkelbacteria bacterium Athens1014_28 TaxID=2017145 RepID=A0A554LPU2_9BACT|nr:MAG: Uncharacterized protein Athens101428_89 [Candidatus Berkelbacteria bacterium Athens1014_28]
MYYYLLLFLALYLPFQIALNPTQGIDLASVRILALLIFFLWLLRGLKEKKLVLTSSSVSPLIISFLFFCLFSTFASQNIQWSVRKLLFLLSFFPLFFVISASLWNKEKIKLLSNLLVLGAFLTAIIGLFQFSLQFILGIDTSLSLWEKITTPLLGNSFSQSVFQHSSWLVNINNRTFFRATSLFPDPHMLSFYLNMLFPLSLAIYFSSFEKKYAFISAVILLASLLTFSRGGYFGLLAGTIFFFSFFLARKKYQLKTASTVAIFFASILVIFFVFFTTPIGQRFFSSFNSQEGSNSERIKIWNKTIEIIQENPLLGVGIGNYPLSIEPASTYRDPIYAHNTYLDLAVETGIITSLIWIAILFLSIFNLTQNKTSLIFLGFSSGIVSFSAHSFFDTAIFSVHVLPLLIIFIAFSAIKEKSYELV